MGCAGSCNAPPKSSCFLRIPAARMLRRGVRALLWPARHRGRLPTDPYDGLHVSLLARSPSDGLMMRRSSPCLTAIATHSPPFSAMGRPRSIRRPIARPLFPSRAPFTSDCRARPRSHSWRDLTLLESPSFQGARPLWSRFKWRPGGPGAGMQSAGKPPTPDAILSPHRLSGFRTRAPLRRSENRPVRTVGRNGGVWYMMRNDFKTYVMMQCHAHA
jgi:hypothetical protein